MTHLLSPCRSHMKTLSPCQTTRATTSVSLMLLLLLLLSCMQVQQVIVMIQRTSRRSSQIRSSNISCLRQQTAFYLQLSVTTVVSSTCQTASLLYSVTRRLVQYHLCLSVSSTCQAASLLYSVTRRLVQSHRTVPSCIQLVCLGYSFRLVWADLV